MSDHQPVSLSEPQRNIRYKQLYNLTHVSKMVTFHHLVFPIALLIFLKLFQSKQKKKTVLVIRI